MPNVGELRAHARRALPPLEGKLSVGGLQDPVEVLRDPWGVPHIYASSLEDVYFAQGLVTAQDRLFQIDSMLRYGNARSAATMGEDALPGDRWLIQSGALDIARRACANPSDRSRMMTNRFMAGARAWAELMPARPVEYEVLDLEPDLPTPEAAETEIAIAWFSSSLSTGRWSMELIRMAVAEKVGWEAMRSLFPHSPAMPTISAPGKYWGPRGNPLSILRDNPGRQESIGSNNWVVGGERTASGLPLLANDPHQGFETPSQFYQVHLSAPGLEVRGVQIPFLPGVIIGHTPQTAWAITAAFGDNADLFLERLNEDGTAALFRGEWEPVQTTTHRVEVKGRHEPVEVEVRRTRHGALLPTDLPNAGLAHATGVDPHEEFALKVTQQDASFDFEHLHDLATARDFDSFRQALRGWTVNEANVIYADVGGDIGYQYTGQYPIRAKGDGSIPVPGWDGEHEWVGQIDFDDLPRTHNPEQGLLVTANARVHDDTYPFHLSTDYSPAFRAHRITELLTATDRHDLTTFVSLQQDTVSLLAREVVPILLEVAPESPRQEQALDLLRGWNHDVAADSAPAAIYELWVTHLCRRLLSHALGEVLGPALAGGVVANLARLLRNPTATLYGESGVAARDDALRGALDAALDDLTDRLGDDLTTWQWGHVHQIEFRLKLAADNDAEPVSDGLADFLTAGRFPAPGDLSTVNPGYFDLGRTLEPTIGATWRQIIDLSDLDASVAIGTHGQSTNPESPHFRDQLPLRAAGQYHPVPITREAIEALGTSTLWCVPDGDAGNRPDAVESHG